jgi:hypothetical protein
MNAYRNAAQNSAQRIGRCCEGERLMQTLRRDKRRGAKNSVRDSRRVAAWLAFDPPLGAGYQTRRALL